MAESAKSVNEKSLEKYQELFPDDRTKAGAFDKIAQLYYMCNFGSTPKADVDLLMFSEYLDRILEKNEDNMSQYSDYTLSKLLGITQARISSLKERKQLKYPYQGFDWKESFLRIAPTARYENGWVIFSVRDRNLFIEIQNAIEENNGYIEMQLNSKLMKIPYEYFLDFLIVLDDGNERRRDQAMEALRNQLKARKQNVEFIESESMGNVLHKYVTAEILPTIIEAIVSVVPFGTVAQKVADIIINMVKRSNERK